MNAAAYDGIFLAPESIVVVPDFNPSTLNAPGEGTRGPECLDAGTESRPTPAACYESFTIFS